MLHWPRPNRQTVRWGGLAVLAALLPLLMWSRIGDALEDGRGPFRDDGLRAATRDHLALCVEGVNGASIDPDSAVANVRSALQRAHARPAWGILRIPDNPTVVMYGCPSPPLIQPSGPAMSFLQRDGMRKYVDIASEFRVFLFIMREADVQLSFGTDHLHFRAANEEMLCAPAQTETGKRCGVVTSGVYLTVSEHNDPSSLEYAILRGLNLVEAPRNLPHNPDIVIAPIPT